MRQTYKTINWSVLCNEKQEVPAVPRILTVIVLMSKPWQVIQFTREDTDTRNKPQASTSQKEKYIFCCFSNMLMIVGVRPFQRSKSLQENCRKLKTGPIREIIVCMLQVHEKQPANRV